MNQVEDKVEDKIDELFLEECLECSWDLEDLLEYIFENKEKNVK